MMRPVRVGQISFTNTLPLYLFFNTKDLNVEIISRVPSGLNEFMSKGLIDVGPISSFAYGKSPDKYMLLPDLSISARGSVRSIFLFTRGTLKELNGQRVAVTDASASSTALLRILLEGFEGVYPVYAPMESNFNKMMNEADACLLIGDEAIRACWSNPGFAIYDLGEEWYKQTNLSMTFAVWVARNEIAEIRQGELREIHSRFIQARNEGKCCKEIVMREAQKQVGGELCFWSTYFEGLYYYLGYEELRGLQAFYDYAYQLNLLDKKVHVSDSLPVI